MTEKEFILNQLANINADGVNSFPDEFLDGIETTELETPGKTLFMGNYLFNNYEVIESDGNPVFQFDDIFRAKYIVYSSLKQSNIIKIPVDAAIIKDVVTQYEKYLDSLLMKIETNYKKEFNIAGNKLAVSNEIFRKLNLIRI